MSGDQVRYDKAQGFRVLILTIQDLNLPDRKQVLCVVDEKGDRTTNFINIFIITKKSVEMIIVY
ncbi:hypothetical protein XSR1_70003 [Xenorhabdus szentirmaii DSM 16338]|uniref:Uncharacterized protein n=1 Tax=Xenorhabdus szentirmaii DSM 16338 TaxID=1427518 RepID=W1J5X5_9GAMM|nr:hypothetical protein XSR1_70003 [Xenorhabdus szentirmaii DSM 16338]